MGAKFIKNLSILIIIILCAGLAHSQIENPHRTYCSNFCETCYWQTDICQRCGERFYFHNFFKVCLEGAMLGCKNYASSTVCENCDQGYKNVKGTCQACGLPLCGVCEQNIAVCEQCRLGFTFSGLVASTSTCNLQCLVENCKKCFNGSGNFCEVCMDGFRKTPSDSCEKCTVEGCKSCSTIATVCDQSCMDGYYWHNGKCEACLTGCKTCSSQGLCLACATTSNYYMDLSRTCIKLSFIAVAFLFGVFATSILILI